MWQPELYNSIISVLKDNNTKDIAIVMHDKPDGDSIGSAVALEEALLGMGKSVDLIIHNKINKRFSPIVGKNRVDKKVLPSIGKFYDILIMVDFSDPKRTLEEVETLANYIIVIDHHNQNLNYGDLHMYENVSSTGMLVYKILEEMVEITPTIATSIYMTIVSDTNGFKNNNTYSDTHKIAAMLIEKGADIQLVHGIFADNTLNFLQLMGETFGDVRFDEEYKITYLVVTRDKILNSGASGEEVAALIDQIRWIKDGDITFLFIEGIYNVRISARSRFTPVNKILKGFGGGGHEMAAGCAIDNGYIHTIVSMVLDSTKKYIDNERKKNDIFE